VGMPQAKNGDYDFSRIASRLLDENHQRIWEEVVRRVWTRAKWEIPVASIVRAFLGFEELEHLKDEDRHYIVAESKKERLKPKAGEHPEHKHHAGRKQAGG
jgi:hypothetical protein